MKRSVSIATITILILISACKDIPVASFTLNADSVEVGETVYFQSTCQNATIYDWDFGDGNGSSEENPSHVYTAEGEYVVHLVISNEDGSDEASSTITVISSNPCWAELADLQTARQLHMTAVVNNKIYVMGGSDRSVEEYDLSSDTWTGKADMPASILYSTACAIDGKIYAVGGWSGFFTSETHSTLLVYDPVTDTWTEKAPMPTKRWGHASVAIDGKIYVIGGALDWWPLVKYYQTVEIYYPETDTWTTKNPPEIGFALRWGFSASVVNGKIYLIGGVDAKTLPGKENYFSAKHIVEEYDPVLNTLEIKSSMPTARFGLATATVNNKIYAIGGGDVYEPKEVFQTVEEYDPLTDTWETKSPMPAGRLNIVACELNNMIYVPSGGGIGEGDNYLDFFVYDPACEAINY